MRKRKRKQNGRRAGCCLSSALLLNYAVPQQLLSVRAEGLAYEGTTQITADSYYLAVDTSAAELKVEEVYVQSGSQVQAGDPLLKLTEDSYQEAVDYYTAAILRADNSLTDTQLDYDQGMLESKYTYEAAKVKAEQAELVKEYQEKELAETITDHEEVLEELNERIAELEAGIANGSYSTGSSSGGSQGSSSGSSSKSGSSSRGETEESESELESESASGVSETEGRTGEPGTETGDTAGTEGRTGEPGAETEAAAETEGRTGEPGTETEAAAETEGRTGEPGAETEAAAGTEGRTGEPGFETEDAPDTEGRTGETGTESENEPGTAEPETVEPGTAGSDEGTGGAEQPEKEQETSADSTKQPQSESGASGDSAGLNQAESGNPADSSESAQMEKETGSGTVTTQSEAQETEDGQYQEAVLALQAGIDEKESAYREVAGQIETLLTEAGIRSNADEAESGSADAQAEAEEPGAKLSASIEGNTSVRASLEEVQENLGEVPETLLDMVSVVYPDYEDYIELLGQCIGQLGEDIETQEKVRGALADQEDGVLTASEGASLAELLASLQTIVEEREELSVQLSALQTGKTAELQDALQQEREARMEAEQERETEAPQSTEVPQETEARQGAAESPDTQTQQEAEPQTESGQAAGAQTGTELPQETDPQQETETADGPGEPQETEARQETEAADGPGEPQETETRQETEAADGPGEPQETEARQETEAADGPGEPQETEARQETETQQESGDPQSGQRDGNFPGADGSQQAGTEAGSQGTGGFSMPSGSGGGSGSGSLSFGGGSVSSAQSSDSASLQMGGAGSLSDDAISLFGSTYDLSQVKSQLERDPSDSDSAQELLDQLTESREMVQSQYDELIREQRITRLGIQYTFDTAVLAGKLAEFTYQQEVQEWEAQLAEVKEEKADLEAEKALLDAMEGGVLLADRDGVAADLSYEVGDTLQAGTPVISYYNMETVSVAIEVPQEEIAQMEVGDTADVTINGFLSREGTVSEKAVEPQSGTSRTTVNYEVTITLDNADGVLSSGLAAQVTLDEDSAEPETGTDAETKTTEHTGSAEPKAGQEDGNEEES